MVRKSVDMGEDREPPSNKDFKPSIGLTTNEANDLLRKWGRNELIEKSTPTWLVIFRLVIFSFVQPQHYLIFLSLTCDRIVFSLRGPCPSCSGLRPLSKQSSETMVIWAFSLPSNSSTPASLSTKPQRSVLDFHPLSSAEIYPAPPSPISLVSSVFRFSPVSSLLARV